MSELTSVHLITLGCARNEVDSEELAGRLADGGFQLVDDPTEADAVLVNTCGFIAQAKKDSIDELLAASDLKQEGQTKAVIAVGCMAERYGAELAESLPEADAVLGFDDYADIAARVNAIIHGENHVSHFPRDRRDLLPLSPVRRRSTGTEPGFATHAEDSADRPLVASDLAAPVADVAVADTDFVAAPDLPGEAAPASGPRVVRRRLGSGPSAPVKLASGCDRRCAFCAIPRFRGAYLSRQAADIVAETSWLVGHGVKEAFLVSENTSSYGKDLGDMRALEKLLPQLSAIDGLDWVRVSYLQPAEIRPGLISTMLRTPKVVPYFDISFQHASGPLLRRMRRFGDADSFLALIDSIRAINPAAGIRSNFIVGFPGETQEDYDVLTGFIQQARLDAIGVFAYSDEDNTEAATLPDHLDEDEIEQRATTLAALADELIDQRAAERIGEEVEVMVELLGDDVVGRAAHQGPEVDGSTTLVGAEDAAVGNIVRARVIDSNGADLIAEVIR